MRNKILILSFLLLLTLTVGAVLNIKLITKQGVNYHVSEIEIPLYLKVLNFYDRHFNYKWLVERLTKNQETKEEKVFRLFQWTHETIQRQPESLPIMDDHVWNVYVRGYGVEDNFHDLFATLCNYIEVDGAFIRLNSKNSKIQLGMSVIKLEKGWVLFDPYRGGYFLNKLGTWATIEDINQNNWKLEKLGTTEISESVYTPYFQNLSSMDDIGLVRANIQSPVNRLLKAVQQLGF
ncbi:MAG: hypothetical protein HOJ13_02480 [Nitrospina sp.]|nr:hypothetical protein [Nitrospina sp.]